MTMEKEFQVGDLVRYTFHQPNTTDSFLAIVVKIDEMNQMVEYFRLVKISGNFNFPTFSRSCCFKNFLEKVKS